MAVYDVSFLEKPTDRSFMEYNEFAHPSDADIFPVMRTRKENVDPEKAEFMGKSYRYSGERDFSRISDFTTVYPVDMVDFDENMAEVCSNGVASSLEKASEENTSDHSNGDGGKDDLKVLEVCMPETSGECLQLVLKNKLKPSPQTPSEDGASSYQPVHCSEILEATEADQPPFQQQDVASKESSYIAFESPQENDDDDNSDHEELVYVEESQPILPGSLDHIPLKAESESNNCTLGEVAEKVLEINVDDPYDLCSLIAAEKAACATDGGYKRRRKRMSDHLLPIERQRKTSMLPRKDLRVSKLNKYPYKCSRCDSWFIESCELKLHMSTHKEKSFKSVKDFIHQKIFKTPEIDKVVINAPIDFKTNEVPPQTHHDTSCSSESPSDLSPKAPTPSPPPPPAAAVRPVRKTEPEESPCLLTTTEQHCQQPRPTPLEQPLPPQQPVSMYVPNRDYYIAENASPKVMDGMRKNQVIYYENVAGSEMVPYVDGMTVACSLCNMQFRSIANLTIHMQIHNQLRESTHKKQQQHQTTPTNPYKCTTCPASFGTSFNLKRHMRIHTGTRPYKCPQCQSAFITKAQLTTHMRTHTGEKPYQCQTCGGKFIQQNNLKRHIMTHTGEKPFKCDKCSAAFISSSDLKRHIRVHTGEKPYKCIHCNKGFTTSGNLSSHYKMHTGEKPYKCNRCDASFSHQSNLKTHVKRHMEP